MPAIGSEPLLAVVVGALFAGGIYTMLRRNLLRFVFGLVLFSNGVNLLIFTVGRPRQVAPPIVPEGAQAPLETVANALPQALILTAIVIAFGLVSFTLVLILQTYRTLGSLRSDELPARLARGVAAEAGRGGDEPPEPGDPGALREEVTR